MSKQNENQNSKNETKINSLDLLLKEVAYTLSTEITEDRIVARVEGYQIKKDRYGRDILVLFLKTLRYGKIVSVYPPMFARMLYERLKKIGIETTGEFFGNCFEFEKIEVEPVKQGYTKPYPRFLPIKKVSCDYLE